MIATAQREAPSILEAPAEYKPYQPFGAALELMYAKDDEVIVDGPAGTGKSRAVLEKLHLVCCKYPNSRMLMVRKTRESLTQSAMMTFETKVLPADGRVQWRTTEQEYRYWNGSVLVVGGLDKSSRIMSTEYDIIYVQEGTEITEPDFEDLTTRARNGIVPYNQVILDCNPSSATHWIKRRWEDGKARRIQSKHEDNPVLYDQDKKEWTPKGVSYLRKLDNLSGVRHQRLRLGLWVTAEGVIYEMFNPDVHIVERFAIPDHWRRFCSVDFGFNHPFVCQWWAVDDENGDMYLYREIFHTRRTVRVHAMDIRRLSKGESIEIFVCDHDAEDRATLEENGLYTTPADKDVSVGIQAVMERLKYEDGRKPSLYFMQDSLVERDLALEEAYLPTHTTAEMDGYVWSNKNNKEQPVKELDDGMDAMRYAAMYVGVGSRANGGIWL